MKSGNEKKKPRILLLSSAIGWIGVARYPKALNEAGAEVYGLYHARSWLRHTRWLDDRRTLPDTITRVGMRRRIYQAIQDWQPTLILPGDDEVVPFLYELWRELAQGRRLLQTRIQRQTLELLNHSLGGLSNLEARYLRHSLIELARKVGARVPEAIETKHWREALAFANTTGFPVVVKQDHSAGGGGVRVCHSAQDLERAFKDFQRSPIRWGIWRRLDPFLPTFLKTFSAPYAPEL